MRVKELKILLNALDDYTEVLVRNHHLEDKPVKQYSIIQKPSASNKKEQNIVLILSEEKL